MNIIFLTIFYLTFVFLINYLIEKKGYLSNFSGEQHQVFLNVDNVPLTGGIFLFLPACLLLKNYQLFILFFSLILILGFLSDKKYLKSARLRFAAQLTIIFFFVFLSDINISNTRIYFLDLLLQNSLFSYFFSVFCILILINGSNFIDGLNGLLLGYFFLIFFFLIYLGLFNKIELHENEINLLVIATFLILVLNFSNKLFMGDSGAYSIGFLISFLLIKIYNLNPEVSPFFIITLIWYPCFENLFSILRKFRFKSSPLRPDSKHLHQLIFFYLKEKIRFKNIFINNLKNILINLFNCFIFFLASQDIYHTKYQVYLILFSIAVYSIIYVVLLKFKYKKISFF